MGGKTQAELSDEIEKKINTLNELITKAKDKNLDAKREEGVIWFANEFVKYANWDENNVTIIVIYLQQSRIMLLMEKVQKN